MKRIPESILSTDVITVFELAPYDMILAIIQEPCGKFKDIDVTYIVN